MKQQNDNFKDRLADSMIGIGIALALFFWVFKAVLQMFLTGNSNFMAQLLGASLSDYYDRLIVIVLFIFFGSHAQYSIRKRRVAELALSSSEEKYRSILESIEEGYYEVDMGCALQFYNDSFHHIFDRQRQELFALDIRQTMTAEAATALTEALAEVGATGQSVHTLECEVNTPSGMRRIVELSASLITDSKQEAKGFRGIVRDITEKKLLERQVLESLKNVKEARTGVILGLAKLAEYRDEDTGCHLERIREYTKILAEELARHDRYRDTITAEYIEDLYHSSILHDIGKVGIADAILLKPGRLTPEEYETMKTHAVLGGRTLSAVHAHMKGHSFLTIGKEIAYHHHERWDGSGYPDGLAGEAIPLAARIVSVADVYDALTSKRCYKEAFTHEKSVEIIASEKGQAFDPMLVEAFIAHQAEFKGIYTAMQG